MLNEHHQHSCGLPMYQELPSPSLYMSKEVYCKIYDIGGASSAFLLQLNLASDLLLKVPCCPPCVQFATRIVYTNCQTSGDHLWSSAWSSQCNIYNCLHIAIVIGGGCSTRTVDWAHGVQGPLPQCHWMVRTLCLGRYWKALTPCQPLQQCLLSSPIMKESCHSIS